MQDTAYLRKIRSFEQVQRVLHRGADKVSINTLLLKILIVSDCIKSFEVKLSGALITKSLMGSQLLRTLEHNTNIPLFDWLKASKILESAVF